jgi:hypothetical protein
LKRRFPNKLRIVQVNFSAATANSVRFLDFPQFHTDWVFFSDVDIFLTESIWGTHAATIEATKLPFNNAVRAGTRRLTGVHLQRVDTLWPSVSQGLKIRGEWTRKNDEEVLFDLVAENVTSDLIEASKSCTRPIPGVHASFFSRFPLSTLWPNKTGSWVGWTFPERFDCDEFIATLRSRKVRSLTSQATHETRFVFNSLEMIANAHKSKHVKYLKMPMMSGPRDVFETLQKRLTESI